MLEIEIIPVLESNYIYLVHDSVTRKTIVFDPAEAKPVLDCLAKKGWRLSYIFNTHHHWDHVGGNIELKRKTNCIIYGFDAGRIPGLDIQLVDGQVIPLSGDHPVKVLHLPGHTAGDLIYFFEKDKIAFVGDVLFAMGCGRLFEGTPSQMHASLKRLVHELPSETKIYSAHEYAESDARFALTVEAANMNLENRFRHVVHNTLDKIPNQPALLSVELETNPFLRTDSAEIRESLGMHSSSEEEVFADLRKRKDDF